MKKTIFFAALFILAACATPTPQVTVTPEATLTAPPTNTPAPTASPQPEISAEVQAKFDEMELKPEQGVDKNGNPIYFVTNPAGEQVTVAIKNAEGKYELGDSLKYKLYATVEEAEASGVVMDIEYVLRGGPGQAAKLNGEPFPKNVITGLNVVALIPDVKYKYYNYLYFDRNGEDIIKRNPGREPYKKLGYFLFINEVGQEGIGTVWQWINPDRSLIYLTTVGYAGADPRIVLTPFVVFIVEEEREMSFATAETIGKDKMLNMLIQQWADTDVIPAELQNHALLIHGTFNP